MIENLSKFFEILLEFQWNFAGLTFPIYLEITFASKHHQSRMKAASKLHRGFFCFARK